MYKTSGREKGTLRLFREKLNRRNVTVDVKHYEDCEQFFASVGKCYVVEALLDFFGMTDAKCSPVVNAPHSFHVLDNAYKKSYIMGTLDKFLDEYILIGENQMESSTVKTDDVWCYAVNTLRSFMLLLDFKDAVATGNGQHLSLIRKQLLIHFFSTAGFNEFSIEMLINILQSEVLLSEAEAFNCKWAAIVNWNGGAGKNIEIDLFQENQNSEMKKLIRSMGANKSDKAITRASKASAGVSKVVESFEKQVNLHRRSSAHSHKSSDSDKRLILADLRDIRPFTKVEERSLESFVGISHDPTHLFDEVKFRESIKRHKKILRNNSASTGTELDSSDKESNSSNEQSD